MGTRSALRGARGHLAVAALLAAAAAGACGDATPDVQRAGARPTPRLVPVEEEFPGCPLGDENKERWGTPCLCCHADTFGVGGSLAPGRLVARIVVRDAHGDVADMTPNPFGNFFQHLDLRGELDAEIHMKDGQIRRMRAKAPHGDCNVCHGLTGPAGMIGG